MSPLRRTKTKIGELLLQKGLITSEQLQEALTLQHGQEKEKPLGQILIERGYISVDELFPVLAVQYGYPYISLKHCVIDTELLSLIHKTLIEKYKLLPVDKFQDILTVAMVNPLDKPTIEEIQKLTKSNVIVFLTTPLEFKEMFSRYYGQG